jgi:hypothetical protein
MSRLFLHLGPWARLFVRPVSGNTPMAARSHPQAVNRAPAFIAALAICGVLGGISLRVPPFIDNDTGYGFLAWRGTLLGAPNFVITPDPANIAQDTAEFLTAFSPGLYLIPGAISLMGVPLGIAMTLTVALSMFACLVGWIMVVHTFAPRTSLALLVVVLIGSFRHSTSEFGIYHGGEILLQGATPWLIMTAYWVPEMDGVSAASVAGDTVFFAFLAKLSGLIVAGAALVAGSFVRLTFGRRITDGMIGGALGGVAALSVVYIIFLARGWTAVSDTSWSLPLRNIVFACLVPWVAGVSWSYLASMLLPVRDVMDMPPIPYFAVIAPAAVLVIGLVLYWRPQTTNEKKLRLFSLWFYAVVAAVFSLLFIHGAAISLEERHFRPAGTLLFVCALIGALRLDSPRWMKGLFFVLCAAMAFYGLASFSHSRMGHGERAIARSEQLDEPADVRCRRD